MPTIRALPFLLAALLASPGPGTAQARPFPYELRRGDAVLLPAGVGLTLLGQRMDGAEPLTPAQVAALTPADVNPFDRGAARRWSPTWARRSDVSRNVLAAAAGLVSFAPLVADGAWEDAGTLATLFVESSLLVAGATYTVKRLVGRKRPYMHNDGLTVEHRLELLREDDEGAFESFYSGHAAAAFASASLLSTVYADVHGRSATSDLLWASSLSVAAFTALARVRAGKHYPSDVLVGAVVGTAVGVVVPRLHRKDEPIAPSASASPVVLVFRLPLGGGGR